MQWVPIARSAYEADREMVRAVGVHSTFHSAGLASSSRLVKRALAGLQGAENSLVKRRVRKATEPPHARQSFPLTGAAAPHLYSRGGAASSYVY